MRSVDTHTTLGGQAQLCCWSLARACTCVCGQMHTGLLTCSHVQMLTFGGGRLIPVWLSPCANMHRSLTLSPVPLTCPCGQSRGRGLVGPQLGSVSAVCSAPQPGNIVTNKHTNRPMIHTDHHTQTPPARVHTHVEMVVGTHLQNTPMHRLEHFQEKPSVDTLHWHMDEMTQYGNSRLGSHTLGSRSLPT